MSNIEFNYRHRGYLHFDAPLSKEKALALVTDPSAVAHHSFYPFISEDVETRKVKGFKDHELVFSDPKIRTLAYAGHQDSHIFTFYSTILTQLYEAQLLQRNLGECVTAFRSLGKNNIHFANEVFEHIRSNSPSSVLAMDVSGFFDNLDHKILKEAWARLLNVESLPEDHYAVFKAITKHCRVDQEKLYETLGIDLKHPRTGGRYRLCTSREFRELVRGQGLCIRNSSGKGIPQGSPISAILANLYMLAFDARISTFIRTSGGLYRRYCDDILIIAPTEKIRMEAEKLVLEGLVNLRLQANPSKTEKIDFTVENGQAHTAKPLAYLGFTFDGRFKRIRPASVARYYTKMRRGVLRALLMKFWLDHNMPWVKGTPIRRRKLYRMYSYLGKRNFLHYAFKAAQIMGDTGIKNQVKRHWKRLNARIDAGLPPSLQERLLKRMKTRM